LAKLDTLIKARFVEMFGDPIINNKKLTEVPMTKICQIIDGDRGKNYPRAKDFKTNGYCLFLNAKNVTTTGFDFHKCMFISKERDELLHNGRLNLGDIVLTTRGTIGNLALYTEKVPYNHLRINSGMVILRMNHEKIIDRFFIEQFKIQLKKIKMKIASGSAQPQLPVSTMSKIPIVLPSIRKQEKYSDFVKQVDKSKVVNASIMKYII
ncbi:restriction endonuclease subunit S, partial [Lactobacillus sp. UMNPBX4]|uniref:restriction endonuclease subunit S n=1 Tax=Lactobacillus sp. UMNPBX4 TaxID=2042043 RepID=UPI000BEEA59A